MRTFFILEKWQEGKLKVVGSVLTVRGQMSQLRQFVPLVEKVILQTKERIWQGNTHVPDKVLSLFEPHTEVIRKGKAHKPSEFGRLVRIDEVENGIVSGYAVLPTWPIPTPSYRRWNNTKLTLDEGRRWRPRTEGFSWRRTKARPRSWGSRR